MIEDTDLYLDKEIHNNAWRADKRQGPASRCNRPPVAEDQFYVLMLMQMHLSSNRLMPLEDARPLFRCPNGCDFPIVRTSSLQFSAAPLEMIAGHSA